MSLPVLAGDGIGPVVIEAAVRVLAAVGVHDVQPLDFGYDCWKRTGTALPEATVQAVVAAGVALVGAATTPEVGCSSPILALRRRLDLDLLVRPAAGLVLVSPCFEGLYAEPEVDGRVVRQLTAAGMGRALDEAFGRARRRVTIVDKPTVFRDSAALLRSLAEPRATVPWELVNADAFVASVLKDRGAYDVIVAESFLGDVLSDLFAALGEGLGAVPSLALGRTCAVFEPVHGSAPRRTEQPPTVDPRGAIRAAAWLLEHRGQHREAKAVGAGLAEHVGLVGPTAEVGARIAETAAASFV